MKISLPVMRPFSCPVITFGPFPRGGSAGKSNSSPSSSLCTCLFSCYEQLWVNGLGEQRVVQREPDLSLHGLAIDDASEGGELQPETLEVVEAGDLLRGLPALNLA